MEIGKYGLSLVLGEMESDGGESQSLKFLIICLHVECNLTSYGLTVDYKTNGIKLCHLIHTLTFFVCRFIILIVANASADVSGDTTEDLAFRNGLFFFKIWFRTPQDIATIIISNSVHKLKTPAPLRGLEACVRY